MMKWLFGKKKGQKRLDEKIIWGIWAPRRLQLGFKVIAGELRVPMSVLVGHVLREWLAKNYESMLRNTEEKEKFAGYLVKKYLYRDNEG